MAIFSIPFSGVGWGGHHSSVSEMGCGDVFAFLGGDNWQ